MSASGSQWRLLLRLDMAFYSRYEVRQVLMEGQHSKAQDEETSPGPCKEPMTEWPLHPGTIPAQAQRWSLCLSSAHHTYVYFFVINPIFQGHDWDVHGFLLL